MVIAFEPQFNIGDVVSLKINPDVKLAIDAYYIRSVDRGKVVHFQYGVFDEEGKSYYFTDIDLELVQSIEQEDES